MKIKLLILFSLFAFFAHGQEVTDPTYGDFYGNTKEYNYRFKLTAYAFYTGEWGISAGFSNWVTYNRIQPCANFSINAQFGKNNIGNRNKPYNKWQLNVIASTFLTYAFSNNRSLYYDEINPFYFGNSSGAFHNYKHSFTLGTSFVALPKGIGRNVMTPRNRSQQLIYVQYKKGDFQFNIYEDYLMFTDNAFFAMLADNRDRFYTGGGNIQLRINKDFTIKYYTEVYTGNSYMDRDDYPDLIMVDDTTSGNFFSHLYGSIGPRRVVKYAYQDPGQNMFNHGRNFIAIQMSSRVISSDGRSLINPKLTNDNLQLMFALQRAESDMWLQNLIHSLSTIDKDLPPDASGCIKSDRLHFFEPYKAVHSFWEQLTIGAAFTSDFVVSKIDNTPQP